MMLRPLLVALTVTLVALAGCSGGGKGGGGSDVDDAAKDLDLDATETTGIIRGVVVTEAIVPILGVTVSLQGVSKTTNTTEGGAFGFDGLEPGTYFLSAHKLGFRDVQQSVEVVAGVDDPEVVKVVLPADPSSVPTYEIFEFHGYLECAVTVLIVFFPCEGIGNDDFSSTYNITGNASFVHVSLVWDPSQPIGTELYMNVGTPQVEIIGYGGGPSPLVVDVDGNDTEQFNEEQAITLEVTGNGEQGLAGVELQQRFDAFIVVFHGFTPPEGYAFWRDGAPVLPS